MKREIEIIEDSGAIKFKAGSTVISDFTIDEVIAIGEVATGAGLFQYDHFLLFITKTKFWHTIPADSEGFNDLIKFVGSRFGITSFIQLANVTTYKSRLIYPTEFEGLDFMKIELIKPRNLLDRLLMIVGLKDSKRVIMPIEAQERIFPELQRIEEEET